AISDWPDLAAALALALRAARRRHGADHLVLRPVLTGASPLLWRMRRDRDLLLEEARLAAEAIGTVWIDKIEIACTDTPRAATAGPLADLARELTAMTTPPAAVQAEAEAVFDALLKALPRELRGMLGQDPEALAASRDALLREGAAEVLAHLDRPAEED